jgi:curved DNA-binding protein
LNGTKKNLLVNDERIEVKIPKGTETGSKIRLENKGNIQSGKGKRGDLLIEVSIKSHPIWKVKGLDVYADLPISLDELALGANISVASPQGVTYLSIPSGSLPEQKLRLKGQGLHNLDTQGDLFFTLKLKFPKNWSDKELRLLEKLRSVRIDEPRSTWFDQART